MPTPSPCTDFDYTSQDMSKFQAPVSNIWSDMAARDARAHTSTHTNTHKQIKINLIFICPCIVNIIPNYNQQDTTFLDLFISADALHVSGGSSTHHQERISVHTASGIVEEMVLLYLSTISSRISASSSIGWQYLKLYVQDVLLMMGAGTAWNMYSVCRNKQIQKSFICLIVIWN